MNGNRGKLAAQAGHAYLHTYWDACRPRNLLRWSEEKGHKVPDLTIVDNAIAYAKSGAAVKICCVVEDIADLLPLYDAYKNITGVSLVKDAGRTVFKGPLVTCLGIGPIRDEDIGEDLAGLPVLV